MSNSLNVKVHIGGKNNNKFLMCAFFLFFIKKRKKDNCSLCFLHYLFIKRGGKKKEKKKEFKLTTFRIQWVEVARFSYKNWKNRTKQHVLKLPVVAVDGFIKTEQYWILVNQITNKLLLLSYDMNKSKTFICILMNMLYKNQKKKKDTIN